MALEAENGLLTAQHETKAVDVDLLVAISVVLAIATTMVQGFVSLFADYQSGLSETHIEEIDESQVTEFQLLFEDINRIHQSHEDLLNRVKGSIDPSKFMNADKIAEFTGKMNIATQIMASQNLEESQEELKKVR